MPNKKPKMLSIIIPCYNEAPTIKTIIGRVKKAKSFGLKKEIIVVDDGSTDKTASVLRKIQNPKSKIQILRHRVNLGKGAAMKTGAEAAFGLWADAVIFMDSDGQHKVEDIPHFIKALKQHDVVFGSRNLSYGVPFVRFIGNKFASVFISLLFGLYVSDILCGYRALTKKAYKLINWESTGYGVETEMVIKTAKYNLKHCEVPVATLYLDSVKGVTILDAFNILFDVIRWRIKI